MSTAVNAMNVVRMQWDGSLVVLCFIFIVHKVSDLKNNLNMEIFPSSGCIPSQGAIELQIKVCPTVVGSFDVKVCVCIRESKQLYIRLAGTVEQPRITVEKVSYEFINQMGG